MKKKKKKNLKKPIICAVAVVLVVAILLITLNFCGKDLSKVDVLRSENFTVSAAMVTYSLYDTYHYYYNYFGEEGLKFSFGIDHNVSLAEQYSDADNGITWFDVFKTEAIDGFCNALALCEAAVDAGVELSEIDRKYIQTEIDEIETLANEDGMTLKEYIKSIYGNSVGEDDIRKSLEIYRLANKMRYREYSLVSASDSEIQAILDEEGDTYLMRDFIYVELTLANDSAKTEKIKEYAQKIKGAATEEEFRALAAEFFASEYCVNKDDNKKVLEQTVQNNVSEDDKTQLDSWFFASGTEIGSTYVYEGSASHVVYMAISEAAMDETPTRDMYTIVFEPNIYGTMEECKAEAERVYALWQEGGAGVESFKSLAAEYTTDYVSTYLGGYYENVTSGDMVDELDSWLFDEELEVGASAILKSEYGYHIMFYSGEGDPAWKAPIVESIKDDKVTSAILNYTELNTITPVNGNMKYIKAK